MNQLIRQTWVALLAVIALGATAAPANAAFTISWNQAGTTVTTECREVEWH